MNKQLLVFNPSIEDGGVEKNLFLITNYLANKRIDITVISSDKTTTSLVEIIFLNNTIKE